MASEIVVVIKLALASFCFYNYSEIVLRKKGLFVVAFSSLYSLCGYSIVSYINIQYMDGLYILPLLMISLYLFLHEDVKKWLILCYAYSFINCFYTGYLLGLFSAFIFLVWLIICVAVKNDSNRSRMVFVKKNSLVHWDCLSCILY